MKTPEIVRDEASGKPIKITVLRPSNFHAHFRRDALMHAVTPLQLRGYKYVLAMPNTGPIRTIAEAYAYYDEIMRIADEEGLSKLSGILMTLYHTADITPAVIEQIANQKIVRAVKHYPTHRPGQEGTTGSGLGRPLEEADDMLRTMEETGVPLLGHFESVEDKHGRTLPHSEREGYFVDNYLWGLRDKYPKLRICFEHCSTSEGLKFVKADLSGRTVCTITPQHLWFTAEDFGRYSWRNHLRCMPYVKTEDDRGAVTELATSGDMRAIAGDDTAPHLSAAKNKPFEEAACGCYLPHAIALYVAKFIEQDAANMYEYFACLNGPKFWGLPIPEDNDTITIRCERRHDIPEPTPVPEDNDFVIPLGWTEEADKLKIGYALE